MANTESKAFDDTPLAASRFSNRRAGDPTRLADGPHRLSCLGSSSPAGGWKTLASNPGNASRSRSSDSGL
jgi:hypothetical protein